MQHFLWRAYAKQHFAQAIHVHRKRVVVNEFIGLPELIHEFLSAYDSTFRLHKQQQNALFITGKLRRFALVGNASALGVELKAVVGQKRLQIRCASLQQTLHMGKQNRRAVGLG